MRLFQREGAHLSVWNLVTKTIRRCKREGRIGAETEGIGKGGGDERSPALEKDTHSIQFVCRHYTSFRDAKTPEDAAF
jgi:hypothetical protein